MVDPDRPPVPGLQHERTALAWDRTGVAFILVGLLFLRATGGLPVAWRLGSIATLGFGGFLVVHGYRRHAGGARRGALDGAGLLRVVGLATIALSIASVALIVARSA